MDILEINIIFLLLQITFAVNCFEEVKFVADRKRGYAISDNCEIQASGLSYYNWIWSTEHCAETCDWYGGACTHFVYNFRDYRCHLKQGRVAFNDAAPNNNVTSCGIRCKQINTRDCRLLFDNKAEWSPTFFNGPPIAFARAQDCFFSGQVARTIFHNTTLNECADFCRTQSWCTHFNYKHNFCYLFPNNFLPSDMKQCYEPGCHCGLDCTILKESIFCQTQGPYTHSDLEDPTPMPRYKIIDKLAQNQEIAKTTRITKMHKIKVTDFDD